MFTVVKFIQLHVCLSMKLNRPFKDLRTMSWVTEYPVPGKVPRTGQMLNKCLLNKPSCLEPDQNSGLNPLPAPHPIFLCLKALEENTCFQDVAVK